MYTNAEVLCLAEKATYFVSHIVHGTFEICTHFYRDKDLCYYNDIFENCRGIMNTILTIQTLHLKDLVLLLKTCNFFLLVFTKADMLCLVQKASEEVNREAPGQFKTCKCFYRDKDQCYYNDIFQNCQGIMKKYEKDCHGGPANPINEQISGLFFSATMDRNYGRPLNHSIFGNTRVKIQPWQLMNENTNLYFADFYCINKIHWVQLVLAENRTEIDDTCSQLLIKLDKYKNPFLYISKTDPKTIYVTTGASMEMFYTHDVNLPAFGINNMSTICYDTIFRQAYKGRKEGEEKTL